MVGVGYLLLWRNAAHQPDAHEPDAHPDAYQPDAYPNTYEQDAPHPDVRYGQMRAGIQRREILINQDVAAEVPRLTASAFSRSPPPHARRLRAGV